MEHALCERHCSLENRQRSRFETPGRGPRRNEADTYHSTCLAVLRRGPSRFLRSLPIATQSSSGMHARFTTSPSRSIRPRASGNEDGVAAVHLRHLRRVGHRRSRDGDCGRQSPAQDPGCSVRIYLHVLFGCRRILDCLARIPARGDGGVFCGVDGLHGEL